MLQSFDVMLPLFYATYHNFVTATIFTLPPFWCCHSAAHQSATAHPYDVLHMLLHWYLVPCCLVPGACCLGARWSTLQRFDCTDGRRAILRSTFPQLSSATNNIWMTNTNTIRITKNTNTNYTDRHLPAAQISSIKLFTLTSNPYSALLSLTRKQICTNYAYNKNYKYN